MGCDGFRMDVASLYSKTPGLPDGKGTTGLIGCEHYQNGPRIHEFLREMNQEVLSHYDIMTVGEMAVIFIQRPDLQPKYHQHMLMFQQELWTGQNGIRF